MPSLSRSFSVYSFSMLAVFLMMGWHVLASSTTTAILNETEAQVAPTNAANVILDVAGAATTTEEASAIIGSEADANGTKHSTDPATHANETPLLVEHGTASTTLGQVTTTLLKLPPLAYLKGVAGDPKPQKGEMSVRVPVFMYHHIREFRSKDTASQRVYIVRPAVFADQMAELAAAGYHTISPSELEYALSHNGVADLPSKPVLLTFDDGFREHFTIVLPILKQYNFKATFFVVSDAYKLNGYMTKAMWKEAVDTGLITIAAHTQHHVYLAKVNEATRQKEIAGSKADLEAAIGQPVTAFAYPYGSKNQTVMNDVKKAGFTLGFGVRLGSLHASSTALDLRRIRVQDPEDLKALADTFSQDPRVKIPKK